MRYPASEKFEIIRLVEQSPLPVKRTLEKLGIPRSTIASGTASREDIRQRIRQLALEEPALSPRELAVRFTDTESYSPTRPRHPMSSGRPTSPISRSSAGAGSICRACSTTSRATSSPGTCARQ